MSTYLEPQETSYTDVERQDIDTSETLRSKTRLLTTLVIVLALALVGIGIWVILDRGSTSSTAVNDEIQLLVDDYVDAWNVYDSDAFLGLVTDDYVHESVEGATTAQGAAQMIDALSRSQLEWRVTLHGQPVVYGENPWYFAQATMLEGNNFADGRVKGMTVFTIVDEGGTLLIAHHRHVGEAR